MRKKIPNKNYIVLGFIIFLTVLAVFYARNMYIAAREYSLSNSPMLRVVNEINKEEINNYAYENPKFILYVSEGHNSDIKSFEKKLKNYIVKKELSSDMLYINSDNLDKKSFTEQLKKYAENDNIESRIDVNENVYMYIFDNGKITHVIKNAEKLTIKQIDTLFENSGMFDD